MAVDFLHHVKGHADGDQQTGAAVEAGQPEGDVRQGRHYRGNNGDSGEKTGAEAVYEAIQWVDGQWKVETINPEDLPAPNNDASNESILMEGCRRLDEKSRSASTSAPQAT